MRRVTLKHIAEAAGLSKSAVSLALRNHPKIPETTRHRVRALADKLGYRPDPALRALASYRHDRRPPTSETIAWITNWTGRDDWREVSPVYEQYYQGASRRAAELGFHLEHFWLREPGMSQARFEQVLWARNIRGLILAPQPSPNVRLNLTWPRYAAVTIGYTLKNPRIHVVSCSHFTSMTLLLARLRERGYGRIGCVLQKSVNERVEQAWLAAYLLDRENSPGSNPLPSLLLNGLQERTFIDWLRRYRPEVIITAEPHFARTIRAWCEAAGCGVPEKTGIAVVSNVPLRGEFSGIHEHADQIGRTATDVLARMLYQNALDLPAFPWRTLIDGTWVEGKTLPPPRI